MIEALKDKIVTQLAERIEKKYESRWVKCVDLAMSASWYNKDYTLQELTDMDVESLYQQVCKEIDSNEIM